MKLKRYVNYKACLFLFITFQIIGCTTSNQTEQDCYKLRFIDSTFFNEYWFMIFENEKAAFNFISKKKPLFDYDSLKYNQLQLDNKYCFNIHLKETPVKATLKGILSKDHPDIILDSQLIWSNGKIRAKVYESDAIVDRFILK